MRLVLYELEKCARRKLLLYTLVLTLAANAAICIYQINKAHSNPFFEKIRY